MMLILYASAAYAGAAILLRAYNYWKHRDANKPKTIKDAATHEDGTIILQEENGWKSKCHFAGGVLIAAIRAGIAKSYKSFLSVHADKLNENQSDGANSGKKDSCGSVTGTNVVCQEHDLQLEASAHTAIAAGPSIDNKEVFEDNPLCPFSSLKRTQSASSESDRGSTATITDVTSTTCSSRASTPLTSTSDTVPNTDEEKSDDNIAQDYHSEKFGNQIEEISQVKIDCPEASGDRNNHVLEENKEPTAFVKAALLDKSSKDTSSKEILVSTGEEIFNKIEMEVKDTFSIESQSQSRSLTESSKTTSLNITAARSISLVTCQASLANVCNKQMNEMEREMQGNKLEMESFYVEADISSATIADDVNGSTVNCKSNEDLLTDMKLETTPLFSNIMFPIIEEQEGDLNNVTNDTLLKFGKEYDETEKTLQNLEMVLEAETIHAAQDNISYNAVGEWVDDYVSQQQKITTKPDKWESVSIEERNAFETNESICSPYVVSNRSNRSVCSTEKCSNSMWGQFPGLSLNQQDGNQKRKDIIHITKADVHIYDDKHDNNQSTSSTLSAVPSHLISKPTDRNRVDTSSESADSCEDQCDEVIRLGCTQLDAPSKLQQNGIVQLNGEQKLATDTQIQTQEDQSLKDSEKDLQVTESKYEVQDCGRIEPNDATKYSHSAILLNTSVTQTEESVKNKVIENGCESKNSTLTDTKLDANLDYIDIFHKNLSCSLATNSSNAMNSVSFQTNACSDLPPKLNEEINHKEQLFDDQKSGLDFPKQELPTTSSKTSSVKSGLLTFYSNESQSEISSGCSLKVQMRLKHTDTCENRFSVVEDGDMCDIWFYIETLEGLPMEYTKIYIKVILENAEVGFSRIKRKTKAKKNSKSITWNTQMLLDQIPRKILSNSHLLVAVWTSNFMGSNKCLCKSKVEMGKQMQFEQEEKLVTTLCNQLLNMKNQWMNVVFYFN